MNSSKTYLGIALAAVVFSSILSFYIGFLSGNWMVTGTLPVV